MKIYKTTCTIRVSEADVRRYFDLTDDAPIPEHLWLETARNLFQMDINTEYDDIEEVTK